MHDPANDLTIEWDMDKILLMPGRAIALLRFYKNRVDELLEANNRYLERARQAEAALGATSATPQPHSNGLPKGFTRHEIEEMLSIVQDEPQTVDGGGEWGPQESTDGWYTRLLRAILKNVDDAPAPSSHLVGVECTVQPMKTSGGTDYYVHLRCGDRTITPHMFKEEWEAEYETAEWKWFFGQGDKPDILAYGPLALATEGKT